MAARDGSSSSVVRAAAVATSSAMGGDCFLSLSQALVELPEGHAAVVGGWSRLTMPAMRLVTTMIFDPVDPRRRRGKQIAGSGSALRTTS